MRCPDCCNRFCPGEHLASPDGKVSDMSAQGAEPVEPGKPLRTTETKLPPMYSCHGADEFGTIHWTLDQLLHGSDESTSIWNPMDDVSGADPEGFREPPTAEPPADVVGEEGDAGMNITSDPSNSQQGNDSLKALPLSNRSSTHDCNACGIKLSECFTLCVHMLCPDCCNPLTCSDCPIEPQSPAAVALQNARQEQQSMEEPTARSNTDLSHTAKETPAAWTEKRTTQHLQKRGRKQRTKKVSISVKDGKRVHPAQRLRQLAWQGTMHAARVFISSWRLRATNSIETCALGTITSPAFRYHAVKEWQRLRREKYAAATKAAEDAAKQRGAYSQFRTGDVSGELLITIMAWLGDSDSTAAHASAACREWKILITKGFPSRFAVAVSEAFRVLNRIPQYQEYQEYCESGKPLNGLCEEDISAAEALLRGDGPDYEDEDRIILGSRLCNGKLPSFIRAICSLIGGGEIGNVFSGGDSRHARLCMLHAHEMKTVGEYIEQWDLVDDCIDVYTGYNNCTLSQALVFACQDDGEDLADLWLYCWHRNRVYQWSPLIGCSTPAEFDVSEWKQVIAPSDEWFCCVAEAMPHSTQCTDAIQTVLTQTHPSASLSHDATKCIMKCVAYVCHQLANSVHYGVEHVHSAGPGATPLVQSAAQGKQKVESAPALSGGDVPFTPSILAAQFVPATAKPTTPVDGSASATLVQQTSIEPDASAEVGVRRLQSVVSTLFPGELCQHALSEGSKACHALCTNPKVIVPHVSCTYSQLVTFCLSLYHSHWLSMSLVVSTSLRCLSVVCHFASLHLPVTVCITALICNAGWNIAGVMPVAVSSV